MAKRVFYSFHYIPDCFRVSQVRNIGAIEANPPAHDNDWEQVKRGGDPAIQRWIDGQLDGRSCAVVMIGAETAQRKWIDSEIRTAWNSGKGVVGVHIHRLLNHHRQQSLKGAKPFAHFTMDRDKNKSLASLVKTYDPPLTDSREVYRYIAANLTAWIDQAIKVRQEWGK